MVLVDFAAVARTVGHLSKSAEVMKLVNNLMKAPEVAVTMQEFSKEMTKVFSLSIMVFQSAVVVVVEVQGIFIVEVSLTATNERNDGSLGARDLKFLDCIVFYWKPISALFPFFLFLDSYMFKLIRECFSCLMR